MHGVPCYSHTLASCIFHSHHHGRRVVTGAWTVMLHVYISEAEGDGRITQMSRAGQVRRGQGWGGWTWTGIVTAALQALLETDYLTLLVTEGRSCGRLMITGIIIKLHRALLFFVTVAKGCVVII